MRGDAFWSYVDKAGRNECWLWRGCSFTAGYGRVRLSRTRTISAHRYAYILTHGRIRKSVLVCHRCDVRGCCNPRHLFAGSHADNVRDCIRKGRRAAPRLGSQHPMAKLTEARVTAIRRAYADGASAVGLAARSGVTVQAIWFILKRHTWRHVA